MTKLNMTDDIHKQPLPPLGLMEKGVESSLAL